MPSSFAVNQLIEAFIDFFELFIDIEHNDSKAKTFNALKNKTLFHGFAIILHPKSHLK